MLKTIFFIQFKAKISPEFENAPVEQLCLIFSGKIMKDHDTLETHNIKDGMTVHLVIRSGNAGANNQQQQSPRPNPEANPSNTPFGLGGVGGVPGMSNLGLGSGQFISTYFQFFSKYINVWSYFISSSHSWARKFYNIQAKKKEINQFPGVHLITRVFFWAGIYLKFSYFKTKVSIFNL